jgi:hypothetical protein
MKKSQNTLGGDSQNGFGLTFLRLVKGKAKPN